MWEVERALKWHPLFELVPPTPTPPHPPHPHPTSPQTPPLLQREHPDSLLATNVHACCEFRAGGPPAALCALGTLPAQLGGESAGAGRLLHAALIRHNAVVFNEGQGGMQVRRVMRVMRVMWQQLYGHPCLRCHLPHLLSPRHRPHSTRQPQVLPPLLDAVPEARLNLVLSYCNRGGSDSATRALALLQDLQPATAFEHICVGVACALHGQAAGSGEHVRRAQECFRAVGESTSELDSVSCLCFGRDVR